MPIKRIQFEKISYTYRLDLILTER